MKLQFGNRQYEMLRGSDLENDGMFLEANDVTEPSRFTVLYAFWSDVDGSFTFTAYREDLPFELVELFVRRARESLTPIKQDD